jgi:hypothetical protein
MRRTPLLAVPALLLSAVAAPANHPKQCYGGYCLLKCQKIHQHGPLFNYGPYYGYPPFEPYGPWNAYLQYNPWYYGAPGAGRCRDRDRDRLGDHLKGLCDRLHACFKDGGWFKGHGCLSGDRKCNPAADPCSPCPVTRCSGVGDPSQSAVFYAGLPSVAGK